MVRLGLISDSHNRESCVQRFLAVAERERYDAVYHMGDGESDARWLGRRLKMPLVFVAGNCDMFSKAAREARGQHEGHRLLAVHGHLYDVRYGLDRLSYFAESNGADIALYGHTHDPRVCFVGPTLMINPGALMDGRYGELLLDGARMVPRRMRLGER